MRVAKTTGADSLEAVERERVRVAYRAVVDLKKVLLERHGGDSEEWREACEAERIVAGLDRAGGREG